MIAKCAESGARQRPASRALFEASVKGIRQLGLSDKFPAEIQADRWDLQ